MLDELGLSNEALYKSATPVHGPLRIAIVTGPGLSLLTLAGILEPFGYLERLKRAKLARYDLEGDIAATVLQVLHSAAERPHKIFICCGEDDLDKYRSEVQLIMQTATSRGIDVLAVGGAGQIAAEAGLLASAKAAIHWSQHAKLQLGDFNFDPLNQIYHRDNNIVTCAGEAATLDLSLAVIAESLGQEVTDHLCDVLQIPAIRSAETPQPGARTNQLLGKPDRLKAIAATMANTISHPLSLTDLANLHGISRRQIERLFSKHLNCSPGRYYLALQIEHAKELCDRTEMSIAEIAQACGFRSTNRMAKWFRMSFGASPTQLREIDRLK